MAASKGMYTKMKEIFGKFIWGGPKQQINWALISWKNLTKRKEEGGLGLRDPEILNKVLGVKLWWRWMRGGTDLWKKIWTQKYNMPTSPEGILRIEETPKGSSIWDLASQNRNIVNKYTFWEIRGGGTARFWEEEWQQKDKMTNIHNLQSIRQNAVREGSELVRDYWEEGETNGIWRKWRKPEEWNENIDKEQQRIYIKELESRKIKARPGADILRWGNLQEGPLQLRKHTF